ncbi:hypothetical protein [Pseudarthrobacter sp. H2]|uniref:hypothetical protein n=1 Tax=Pseudarthrobacter sp. H2 TaxID=3418415 RepID=UPI003CF17E55
MVHVISMLPTPVGKALAAVKGGRGNPWIWAATAEGIVVSTDGGTTFRSSDAS